MLLSLLGATFARQLDFDAAPFTKVIQLLEGMKKDLEKEAKEDTDENEKMECWCKAAEENQTRIISESDSLLESKTFMVKENIAMGEKLTTELRHLAQEIASNEATLSQASALREDQKEKFAEDEKSLTENIGAVTQALSNFKGNALLQSPMQVMTRLKQVVDRNEEKIRAKWSKGDRMLLDDFLKENMEKGVGFLQNGKTKVSGPAETVAGMLEAMKDDFTVDLKEEQTEDAKLEKSYQALVAAKTKQVTAGKEQVTSKEVQKAEAKEKVATGKEDIKSAKIAKAEAEDFLKTAQGKCAKAMEGFEGRSAARNEELSAVGKATEVLTSEKAKSLGGKKTSFLQLTSSTHRAPGPMGPMDCAAAALAAAGRDLEKEELVSLSLRLKSGSFDKVKEAIEGMMRALTQEQKDEVLKHDECQKDFDENTASTDEKTEKQEMSKIQMGGWKNEITAVEEEISKLKGQVTDLQAQMKAAQESRAKENSDFVSMAADQRTTQKILGEAQEVLQKVYEGVSLVQVRSTRNTIPGFAVMEMLKQVMKNSVRLEEEAKEADQESMEAFEKLSGEIDNEITSTTKDIGKKSITKANLESDVAEGKRKMGLTEAELESLAQTKAALHQSCDFVVKNFEIRQKARGAEIQALEQAKAILP
mgnify:CR=1 FL=1